MDLAPKKMPERLDISVHLQTSSYSPAKNVHKDE